MNRTEEYYRITREHREALRAIWSAFDDTMRSLERYKGSAGYEEDRRKAETTRDQAIKAQAQQTGKAFDAVLQGMREKAGGQIAIPPTEDELRLLQVLKLRDVDQGKPNAPGLTREELQAAGRALQGNTVALHALESIAAKHGFHNMFIQYPAWNNTASVHQQKIANLTESARRIVQLTKPDSRQEAASAAVNNKDLSALRTMTVDRDFPGEREAISFLGNLSEGEYSSFAAAVND